MLSHPIGKKDNLIISVQSYVPHVTCSKPGTAAPVSPGQCALMMNDMYASTNPQVFGPRYEPGVEAGLPFAWAEKCAVIVNTRGPLDTATWYEIWEGARAVAGMCVRERVGGISMGHGILGNIFVLVKAASLGVWPPVGSEIASA